MEKKDKIFSVRLSDELRYKIKTLALKSKKTIQLFLQELLEKTLRGKK